MTDNRLYALITLDAPLRLLDTTQLEIDLEDAMTELPHVTRVQFSPYPPVVAGSEPSRP